MTRVAYPKIGDAMPPPSLKDGPHELVITKAYRKAPKSNPEVESMCEIVIVDKTEPDANAIFFYLVDPISLEAYIDKKPDKSEEDWKKSEGFKALNTKQFLTAFDIPFDDEGFDLDDFLGNTATLITSAIKDPATQRVNVSMKFPEVV